MSTNAQDSQAKIPQFFIFTRSRAADVHVANEVPITKSADSPMKENSSPHSAPDHPNRPGWYWSELGGGWYKTAETLDKERSARLSSILEEESSSISPSEEARIQKEVRTMMNQ